MHVRMTHKDFLFEEGQRRKTVLTIEAGVERWRCTGASWMKNSVTDVRKCSVVRRGLGGLCL